MNPLFFINAIPLPWKITATSLMIVVVFFAGYFHGKKVEHINFQNYQLAQEKKYADLQKKLGDLSVETVTKYITNTNVIEKRIPEYVQISKDDVPSQYNLSVGWVYTHDIATTNNIPDATRSSDATPSAIKDNTALATITENYAICQENSEQLMSLQNWIKGWINTSNKSNKGSK